MARRADGRTMDSRRFDRRRSMTKSPNHIKLGDPGRFQLGGQAVRQRSSVFGGSRSAMGPTPDDVGSAIADDMFGGLYALDLEDGLDIELDEEFGEDLPATPQSKSWKDQVPAPVVSAVQAVQAYIDPYVPGVKKHAVRGGYGMNGQPYAELIIDAYDPLNVIQQVSSYALQVSGANGVSVSAPPPTVPGQVRLVFSYGSVPTLAAPVVASPPKM